MRLRPAFRPLIAPLVVLRVLVLVTAWVVLLGAASFRAHWPDLNMRVHLPGWWA